MRFHFGPGLCSQYRLRGDSHMSMNSFSLRAERQNSNSFEQEAPELLQLCVEGDPSPRENKRHRQKRKAKDLDSSFQDRWKELNKQLNEQLHEQMIEQRMVPHNDLQLTVLIADH